MSKKKSGSKKDRKNQLPSRLPSHLADYNLLIVNNLNIGFESLTELIE